VLAQSLWDSKANAEAWNFGPDDANARPVRWIVERLSEAWGEPINWQPLKGDKPHEAHHLKVDSSKARARLGWEPAWSLADSLASIGSFYRALRASADLRGHALDQIAAFQAGDPPPATAP
jgi:CDP-glucose 4,6-dehydratase